ncbi:uncharacterized protein [Littorina saxatilis]|uniref:uncharacterized protein n=1 Tax=Littorina saxatilis TaxID=31220 RepID=UPI0038B4F8DD
MKGDTLGSTNKTQSPSQSSSMETSGKKESPGFSIDQSILDQKEKPLLSEEWQFSKTFSTQGGTLDWPKHSDVKLKIPTGAIKGPEGVKISGAVSVNLEEIHTKLKLLETQYIAGPVVEYSAGDADFRFKKPVEIILPHFIETSAKGRMFVTVYEFSQKRELEIKELEEIPVPEQSQDGGTPQTDASDPVGRYWFGENNRVHLLVDHFSGYCLVAGCENLPPENLQLDLYAEHSGNGNRRVAVRLVIRNEKLAVIKDFDKAQNQVANVKRMTKVDSQILRKLNPSPTWRAHRCVCAWCRPWKPLISGNIAKKRMGMCLSPHKIGFLSRPSCLASAGA